MSHHQPSNDEEEEDSHSHLRHNRDGPEHAVVCGGDVGTPRQHHHPLTLTLEDELDLERELEMLLQSPMLYSSPELGLELTEPSLLAGGGVAEHCATPSDSSLPVTKGKGKRLRVEVRCSQRFTWPEMQLGLVDLTDSEEPTGQECPDFFVCTDRSTLQDEETGGTTAVIEVHVSRVRAKLQFHISIQSDSAGWSWRGQTVPFITHNNGKDRVPRKRGSAAGGVRK